LIRVLKAIGWGLAHAYGWVLARLVGIMGFAHASVWAGQIRGPFGEMVRQAFYRRTLRETGNSCTFRFGCNFSCPDIRVGHHVRVGYGTHVGLVDIGEGSVIGSGSVVTRPIPPWSVAVGNPARVIRSRRAVSDGVPATREPEALDNGISAASLSGDSVETLREG
jgi:acetyltransferase-like isoleucine patch superfamily enzyme